MSHEPGGNADQPVPQGRDHGLAVPDAVPDQAAVGGGGGGELVQPAGEADAELLCRRAKNRAIDPDKLSAVILTHQGPPSTSGLRSPSIARDHQEREASAPSSHQ